MASRFLTAGLGALTAALWTAAAMAAPPAPKAVSPQPQAGSSGAAIALDRSGRLVNLDLGSALPAGTVALQPFGNNAGVASFTATRERGAEPFGMLFPGSAALRSTFLFGSSTSVSSSFALSDSFTLGFGHTALALDDYQPDALTRDLSARLGPERHGTGTTSAALNWNFVDWGDFGLTATQGRGNGALLGVAPGSLASAGAISTNALGISARVGFGEGWVTSLSYSEGVTQLDLSSVGINASSDPLHSQAYGISLAKQGLFGGDALGIAVSRPLEIYSGNGNLAGLGNLRSLSADQVQESDVELGYVTTFLDGTLALQANAAYQMNAAGSKGQNALTGLARAKLNF